MTDYGHELIFGTFVTPANDPPHHAVELAVVAEEVGLDLVTFQDHPYQPRFHDTWTLIAYTAALTQRIHIAANVTNLPLRPPAVLARSVASADLLSGGRIELGLGAGGFWDAIEAMGGRRLRPGQSISALEEAIAVIRGIWDTDRRAGLTVEGEFYPIRHAKRGPAPAHPPAIWVGGYKPRMLGMIGRLADGWVPSLSYLPGGLEDLVEMNRLIDEAAVGAGRAPREVRRFLNIAGHFSHQSRGLLDGPPDQWVEELTDVALTYGISGFILASDATATTELFARSVAPAVRSEVAAARASRRPR